MQWDLCVCVCVPCEVLTHASYSLKELKANRERERERRLLDKSTIDSLITHIWHTQIETVCSACSSKQAYRPGTLHINRTFNTHQHGRSTTRLGPTGAVGVKGEGRAVLSVPETEFREKNKYFSAQPLPVVCHSERDCDFGVCVFRTGLKLRQSHKDVPLLDKQHMLYPRVCVWLPEITGLVIYVDIEPAVLIQTLTAAVGVRGRMKRGGGW